MVALSPLVEGALAFLVLEAFVPSLTAVPVPSSLPLSSELASFVSARDALSGVVATLEDGVDDLPVSALTRMRRACSNTS